MFCPQCGTQLPEDAKYCLACGHALAAQPDARAKSDRPGEERDQIIVGDVTNSTSVAIGTGAQASVTTAPSSIDVAKLFKPIYEQIQLRNEQADVDKEELNYTVRQVQEEVLKGDQANESKLKRWLRTLAEVAPDILETTAKVLENPKAGLASAIRILANKMRDHFD